MCTVTWHDRPDGFRVFFNRDERRERGSELPPRVREAGGVRLVAPLDGDHGGTWIAVNEHGLTVFLINGFRSTDGPADAPGRDYVSRGRLPLAAVERATPGDAVDAIRVFDLHRFRPFLLAVLAPGAAGVVLDWNGTRLRRIDGRPRHHPLISSSFYTEQVRSSRTAVFGELERELAGAPRTELHLRYHASHLPRRGPHSPCMHRPDASTVSFSRIDVGPLDVRFHYAPHSPCRGLPAAPSVVLERRRD